MQKKAGKIYFIDKELTDAEVDEQYIYPVWFVVSETIIDEAGEPYEISKHIIYNRNGIKSIFTGSGGGGYVLPIASPTVLGGIKVGNNLTIDIDGKLNSISAPQVNSDWNSTSGVAQILNKPTIPTKTSDLTNDSNFITQTYFNTNRHYYTITTANSTPNKTWTDGTDLWFTNNLGVNTNLNPSNKLDKLTTTAQTVASQVTFNGNVLFPNLTVSSTVTSLIGLGVGNTSVKIETQKITDIYTGASNLTASELNTNYAECLIVQAPNIASPGIYYRVGATWRFTSGTLVS